MARRLYWPQHHSLNCRAANPVVDGDYNPIEYGGGYLYSDPYKDYNGQQHERFTLEHIEPPPDDDVAPCTWEVYQVDIDRIDKPEEEWWGPKAREIVQSMDCRMPDGSMLNDGTHDKADERIAVKVFLERFRSDDPMERLESYLMVAGYFGWREFDEQPLRLTRGEVNARYRHVKRLMKRHQAKMARTNKYVAQATLS